MMTMRSDGIGPEPGVRMLTGVESITALGSGDTQSSGEASDGNILTRSVSLSHSLTTTFQFWARTEVIETVPVSITHIITGSF